MFDLGIGSMNEQLEPSFERRKTQQDQSQIPRPSRTAMREFPCAFAIKAVTRKALYAESGTIGHKVVLNFQHLHLTLTQLALAQNWLGMPLVQVNCVPLKFGVFSHHDN